MQKKEKILIIDDSITNIQFIFSIIGQTYDVFFAKSGAEGIKIAELKKPDLILLDVVMPDMDGYAVIKKIKQIDALKDIPVIFITVMDKDEDEQKGLECGAIDYITKPIRPAIAMARIRNHLLLKQQRDLLQLYAIHDKLTGLYNRRFFYAQLEKEWARCQRSGTCLSIIMIDIDFFKQYNDNYGHLQGDSCLEEVAQALQSTIKRPMDILARYGGEEFIMLLPETELEGAVHIAEKAKQAVSELKLAHAKSRVSSFVTISSGIAAVIPERADNYQNVINEADENLYRAKEGGRDRVVYTVPNIKR